LNKRATEVPISFTLMSDDVTNVRCSYTAHKTVFIIIGMVYVIPSLTRLSFFE